MGMTAQQPDLRARDVAIAKLLGWRVVPHKYGSDYGFWLKRPDGTNAISEPRNSESTTWNHAPLYSTDPGECARLLVEVMKRGWFNDVAYVKYRNTEINLSKFASDGTVLSASGASDNRDPVLAWCAACSEACLKALEMEVASGK